MITKYLKQYPNASRQDIDTLLLDKLSDVLSENQKRIKVKNLLAAMSRDGLIRNTGSRRFPLWVLWVLNSFESVILSKEATLLRL